MKRCSKCGEEKPFDEFHRRRAAPDGHHTYCKACKREYHREWYRRNEEAHKRNVAVQRRRSRSKNRDLVRRLKDVPCADCGLRYPYFVMDFDHVHGEKRRGIAQMWAGQVTSALLEEIAKCEVVCANCHRIRTWSRARESNDPNEP